MRQSDNSEAAAALRDLRLTEVAALVDLWVASWREAMPAIDFEARRPWIADFLRARSHATLVAAIGSEPLGFVTMERAHLHQLVVASPAKGRGIATALLEAAKARAPGSLTLEVNEANVRAVRFYEREGFRTIGEGINPASGLATWIMRWP